MSRVDVPTLKCDRCGSQTQNTLEMARFRELSFSHMSGREQWDLCQDCWQEFQKFIAAEGAES